MSSIEEVKRRVGKLVAEKGLSFNNIALRLGKNSSYLQKFVKEKSPKRLDEGFRHGLSQILGVDEQLLTDLPLSGYVPLTASTQEDCAKVNILDVKACCSNDIENLTEQITGCWQMPLSEFKKISFADPRNVYMLQASGDSMQPTIADGDWALVDLAQNFMSSDGIYLIRLVNGLAIKRLQARLNNITVKSDNTKYDDITAEAGELTVIGKIIYILNAKKV